MNKECNSLNKYIQYDFEYIKDKFNKEYKNINEDDFKKMIPMTSDRRKLEKFNRFYKQVDIY